MDSASIGRYQIKKEIGRGGMATVFQAFDPDFEREVAIKILPREFLHNPNFRARFKREAKIIAGLEHPAIVPVYDYGEDAGQPFIVMRLMQGGSLADRLQAGPLALADAARICSRIAGALDEAHKRGIVHRDLKPANILFDNRDEPYISDFGIAKLSEGGSSMTGSNLIGTPAYMSPEQAKGERNVDGRSDIYAFGAILFEMLTGKLPYDADTPMGLVVKHITEPIPRLSEFAPDLPAGCEAVINRAMAKERSERFATAAELADTLSRAVASPHQPTARPVPASRKGISPWAWVLGAAVILGCLTLGGVAGGGLLMAGLAPTPAGPTRTAAASPTDAPATTTAATSTAIVVIIPSETVLPTRTPAPSATPLPEPRVFEFRACLDTCLPNGSNATSTFPEKTARVYLHWRFENIPTGSAYSRTWSNRGEVWVRYECTWPGPPAGEQNLSLREPEGLRGGNWEVKVTVNGVVALRESIFVEGQWDLWTPPGTINQCG